MIMNNRRKVSISISGVRCSALATHSENKSLEEGGNSRRRSLSWARAFRFTLVKRGVRIRPSLIGRKRQAIILSKKL